MPEAINLTQDQIAQMKVTDAAEYCGYTSVKKFEFDFLIKFKKQFKEIRREARVQFIKDNWEKMDDKQLAHVLNISSSSVRQIRINNGLRKRQIRKDNHFGSQWIGNDYLEVIEIPVQKHFQICCRLINRHALKSKSKLKIKIKKMDQYHASFKVLFGRTLTLEGEYYNPMAIFNIKDDLEKFIGRLRNGGNNISKQQPAF